MEKLEPTAACPILTTLSQNRTAWLR